MNARWRTWPELHHEGDLFELFLEGGEGAAGSLDVGGGGAGFVSGDAVAALGKEAGDEMRHLKGIETGAEELTSQEGKIVGGKFLKVLHSRLDADSRGKGYESDADGCFAREAMRTGKPSTMG
jgi:hypothetical protein